MTSHADFFQTKKPAAVLKHTLLGEYSRVFASMVGSRIPGPVWVIDGYAGAGAYESDNGAPTAEGSPLVVLRSTGGLSGRDVRAIFIESDPTLAAKLNSNVEPFRQQGRHVEILVGDVSTQIGRAWALVDGQPVVTFLDPFGVAMNRDTMCDVLLNRTAPQHPSEVILNINLEAVRRIGGNLEWHNGSAAPKRGQEAGVLLVDGFLGGSWWRNVFYESRQANGTAAAAAIDVINRHRDQIKALTGRDSLSVEIRRRPCYEPLFLLTLFFSHAAAGYKFADAASRATKSWRSVFLKEELDDVTNSAETLFGPELESDLIKNKFERQEQDLRREWVNLICQNIIDSPEPALSVARDLETILGTTIGLAGESHIKSAWDLLATRGEVAPRDTGVRNLHQAWIVRKRT